MTDELYRRFETLLSNHADNTTKVVVGVHEDVISVSERLDSLSERVDRLLKGHDALWDEVAKLYTTMRDVQERLKRGDVRFDVHDAQIKQVLAMLDPGDLPFDGEAQ